MKRPLLALLLADAACTSMVVPPAAPADSIRVYLLHEALHTGLVLPPNEADAEFVEFGFGDWSWYALGNEAWYDAFATVLWPTAGALGRRTFGATTDDELQRAVTWAELSPITVSAAKAAALRHRLQTTFDAHRDQAVDRRDLGFRFVPSPDAYWLPQNCADTAATWLRALDCHVVPAPLRRALCVQTTKQTDP